MHAHTGTNEKQVTKRNPQRPWKLGTQNAAPITEHTIKKSIDIPPCSCRKCFEGQTKTWIYARFLAADAWNQTVSTLLLPSPESCSCLLLLLLLLLHAAVCSVLGRDAVTLCSTQRMADHKARETARRGKRGEGK
jgi:hypothetical protein